MLLCKMLTCHQPQLVSLLVIFVVASVTDLVSPVPVPGHQGIAEITLLEESWRPDHRVRRAADSDLPDGLSFSIPVDDDKAVLRMNRSRLLPVIMSDEESTREANGFCEGAAVYTDMSMGSAMIVKRGSGHYMLQGSFVYAHVAWDLQHETRHKRESNNATSNPHRISRQVTSPAKFRGDALQSPGATTQRNSRGNDTLQPDARRTEGNPTPGGPTQHVVEVAFIVDYADYAKWVQYVGIENALREMRLWYTYVAESMNIRYQTIKDPDIAISTTVTVLRIVNDEDDADLFTNRTDTDNVLDSDVGLTILEEWYPSEDKMPHSDHYMLFTGMNLTDDETGEGLNGVTWGNTLCEVNSVSICLNDFNENVGNTAAHELAHSMSADHDGTTNETARCTSDDEYIMGSAGTTEEATKEGNSWRFSPCSIEAFKSFLPTVNCTRETNSKEPPLPESAPGERAGEVLSHDKQCRLSFQNATSYFCKAVQEENGGMKGLCRGMYCAYPKTDRCTYITPQAYTPCGRNKWCVTGKCVDKRETNTTTSTAATTVVQPLTTSSTATTTASTYSSPRNAKTTSNLVNITSSSATIISHLITTPSTTSTTPSHLSTLASSTTTIASVTFCLCLVLLSVY